MSGEERYKMIPFKLNIHILKDAFSDTFSQITLYAPDDTAFLEDVRFFRADEQLYSRYIYIIKSEEICFLPATTRQICFIVVGRSDIARFPRSCCALFVEDNVDLFRILAHAQDTFEKYRNWNMQLYEALDTVNPLDAMLQASRSIFCNPIFVHDTGFNILSYSHRVPGMVVWEQDSRTGNNVIPLNLINDFKVDPEYLHTLTTTEPSLYPAEQRGYPILYMNIWREGRYEGRICVDELETSVLPGQYLAIDHLAKLIVLSLGSHRLMQFNLKNSMRQFFHDYLEGSVEDSSLTFKMMQMLNWKRHDSYLCLRLDAMQHDARMMSSAATLAHIETQVSESCAFVYQNGISVIVNLTYSNTRIPDVLSNLAILLREGLMKMGTSPEITDFLLIPQGHYQAMTALSLGLQSSSMNWYYRFDDYFLDFLHMKASETLPPHLLCSQKLMVLKDYDKTNHTELYTTLKAFLELERNVLQTSKKLFIHRSTLFYRLERICKIADVNLDDQKERLVLSISFYFLELEEQLNSGELQPDPLHLIHT